MTCYDALLISQARQSVVAYQLPIGICSFVASSEGHKVDILLCSSILMLTSGSELESCSLLPLPGKDISILTISLERQRQIPVGESHCVHCYSFGFLQSRFERRLFPQVEGIRGHFPRREGWLANSLRSIVGRSSDRAGVVPACHKPVIKARAARYALDQIIDLPPSGFHQGDSGWLRYSYMICSRLRDGLLFSFLEITC